MALKEGSRVFLRFDSPSRGRLLQPGIVQEIREGGLTLAFDARHHAVEIGEEKVVYYNRARDFVQQPVLVEAQTSDGPPFVLSVKSIGDAVSAGTREEDRVSTIGTGLTATLEDEDSCLIQDVSLSGLAVVSNRKYPIGRCLEIAIRYGMKNMSARWRSNAPTGSTAGKPATDCSAFSTPRREEASRTA